MTVNKIPSSRDLPKFWEEINKQKEKSRIQLAKLPFEKKIEILEQMQRDWQELMMSKNPPAIDIQVDNSVFVYGSREYGNEAFSESG